MPEQCAECDGTSFEFGYGPRVSRGLRGSRLIYEFCLDCGLVARIRVEEPGVLDGDPESKPRRAGPGGDKGRSGPYGNGSYL